MAQIIESIPNISEGRNQEVIEACVDQIRTTAGCTLLNYSSDPNHNRTVITYIGDAKGVEEASVKLAKKAVELINGQAITEFSGNVELKNIKEIAEIGVDYISVGALTHSSKILDLSMKNLKNEYKNI